MIMGAATEREARVRLEVMGARGRRRIVDAVIDTGFTEWLTLPAKLVAELGLSWHGFGLAFLGDGSECVLQVHNASVFWDGRIRRIRVNVAEVAPLVGMALLVGHELRLEVREGGKLTIRKLKEPPRRRPPKTSPPA